MNNLLTLIKYSFINNIGINKLRKKKNLFSSNVGFFIFGFLILTGITIYMYGLNTSFALAGNDNFGLIFGVILVTILILITNISKSSDFIFKTKDYDLLMTLPIKVKYIVISKLISLYLYNLMFAFIIMIPTLISYFFIAPFSISATIIYLLILIFCPFTPIILSCFIGFLIGIVPLPKKSKNIFLIILSLIVVFIFFYYYFIFMGNIGSDGFIDLNFITKFFYTNWIYKSINSFSIELLYFIIVSILSLVIYVASIGLLYKKINAIFSKTYTNKNFKLEDQKEVKFKDDVQTILGRELTQYFNMPMYLLNTIMGPILSIILCVFLIFNMEVVENILSDVIPFPVPIMYFLFTIGSIFLISMSNTTSSAISLEGKAFWILKSAPVKTSSIFIGKSLLNIIINSITILINSVFIGIIFKVNIILIITAIILLSIYNISFSFLGLYINLKNPKFDFDNPIKVVKQSAAVFKTMILSLSISMVLIFISAVLINFLEIAFVILLNMLLGFLFLYFTSYKLFKKGNTIFYHLNN